MLRPVTFALDCTTDFVTVAVIWSEILRIAVVEFGVTHTD
jgi:hypothetical protein